MTGLPTATQIAKLKATGKVADVEDEGMDEGRFFVHLTNEWTWNDGNGLQRTRSFGNFLEAMQAVKKNPTEVADIARGGIERHLGDVAADYDSEADAADAIYDEAYTLGFDALVDAGVSHEEARKIAASVAQCYAQP